MADIQSAAQWLGRLLVEEAKYLSRVEKNVKELQDELGWMLCFLREADAIQYDNVMARRWVNQIREFAYEAEDTIEQFLIKVDPTRRQRNLLTPMRRVLKIIKKILSLHQVGSKIDSLKNKISLLTSKLQTYGIQLKTGESSSSDPSKLRDNSYTSLGKKKLIGRDNEQKALIGMLLRGPESNEAKVISILGGGGVGKTFLAKTIFQDERIRKHFDAFAWAYVSQPCQSSAVQQDLLSSLTSKSKVQIAQMSDSEMKNELHKVQQKKKCLIVLDGIWGEEVWNSLKKAFQMTRDDFRSKLLITSESEKVARHVYTDVHICKLKGLSNGDDKKLLKEMLEGAPLEIDEDSKNRLEQKLKGVPAVIFNKDGDKLQEGDPADEDQPSSSSSSVNKNYSVMEILEKLMDKMLRHCNGLPLAISVLGGVLATKRTLKEWLDVESGISSDLIHDHFDVQPWRRILELSYYDLPYQLKPSFLYLGYFPTNLEIPTTKIIRLWVAEGLVSLPGDDESSEGTLEDVAEKYLGELIERSLVQVGSRGITGKAKTFRVHDFMRNLCLAKAAQGNLLSIYRFGVNEDPGTPSSSKYSKKSKMAKKCRRLAIYYSGTSDKLPSGTKAKFIRSLLFFNTLATEDVLIILKKKFLEKIFTDYKLLRVLDIENIEVQSLPSSVGSLIHLRYLSIRGSLVSKLPLSISNLRCLQTLDLRVLSFVRVRIPDVLWKMQRLVHLYLPTTPDIEVPIQLNKLLKLETLVNFSSACKEEDLAKLLNLRKFSSRYFFSYRKSIEPFLSSSSSKLQHIEHLSLLLDGELLTEISQKLESLEKLCVRGQVPASFSFHERFPKLIKLSFYNTEFQSDSMEVLGKLVQLKMLSLNQVSFEGMAMKCSKGGFPELEYLTLNGLKNLKDWIVNLEGWEVKESAMAKLYHLKINDCQNLETIPYIKSLKELEISYMPFSFFNGLCPHNEEIHKWVHYQNVKHIPHLNIYNVLELDGMQEYVNSH